MPGHIEWIDDERCNIIIEEGKDPATGKRKRQKHAFCGSKKQANLELARYLMLQEQGLLVDPSKMTFAQLLEKWLEYAKPDLEASTFHRYREIVYKDIIPNLGQINVQKMKPLHVQNFETKMRTEGKRTKKKIDGKVEIVTGPLARSTVTQYHRIIHVALACAVQWLIVPRNVADAVKPPKKIKVKRTVLDFNQAICMLKAAKETDYYIQIILATLTGMRLGEIYGTRLQDIDFEKGTITTNKAAQYVPGEKLSDKLPKDDEIRVIDIADLVIDILKTYRAKLDADKLRLGEKYLNPDMYLCVDDNGNRLHLDSITQWFPKWIVSIGLPRITFHDLRHTHATLMLTDTKDLKLVSTRLGHASVAITGDIYGHVLAGRQKKAAASLEKKLLGGHEDGAHLVPKVSKRVKNS